MRILLAIDTSGSVSDTLLDVVNLELASPFVNDHDITVIEFDMGVANEFEYTGSPIIRTRMGTADFEVPFRQSVLSRINPDMIIVCTDGYGPAPTNLPDIPVFLRIVNDTGERYFGWGTVINNLEDVL